MRAFLEFARYYPLMFFFVVFTVVPVLFMWKKKVYFHEAYRYLFIYFVFKLLIDVLMLQYATTGSNNLLFSNIFVLARYVLLSAMCYRLYTTGKFRKWIWYTSWVYLAISCVELYYCLGDLSDGHDNLEFRFSNTLECVLMICWILLYYYEIIGSLKIVNLLSSPSFLITAGFLVFYSVLVFIAPALSYVNRWDAEISIGFLRYLPGIFEVLCGVLIVISFWNYSPLADESLN